VFVDAATAASLGLFDLATMECFVRGTEVLAFFGVAFFADARVLADAGDGASPSLSDSAVRPRSRDCGVAKEGVDGAGDSPRRVVPRSGGDAPVMSVDVLLRRLGGSLDT
jgi:hypothetical protein